MGGLWDYDEEVLGVDPPSQEWKDKEEFVSPGALNKGAKRRRGEPKQAKHKETKRPQPKKLIEVMDLLSSDEDEGSQPTPVPAAAKKEQPTQAAQPAQSKPCKTRAPALVSEERQKELAAWKQLVAESSAPSAVDGDEDLPSASPVATQRFISRVPRMLTAIETFQPIAEGSQPELLSEVPQAHASGTQDFGQAANGMHASATQGAGEAKEILVCKCKQGELKLSLRLHKDTVGTLCSFFLKAAEFKGWLKLPKRVSDLRAEFDGDVLKHEAVLQSIGLQDDDVVDMMWKNQ